MKASQAIFSFSFRAATSLMPPSHQADSSTLITHQFSLKNCLLSSSVCLSDFFQSVSNSDNQQSHLPAHLTRVKVIVSLNRPSVASLGQVRCIQFWSFSHSICSTGTLFRYFRHPRQNSHCSPTHPHIDPFCCWLLDCCHLLMSR